MPAPSKDPDRRCPDDHSHKGWCYSQHKCRCDRCRAWRSREHYATEGFYRAQRARAGRNIFVPAAPAVRKVQALACMGWSANDVGERIGVDGRTIGRFRSGTRPTARIETVRKISRVYRELSTVKNDTRSGRTTITLARRAGWVGPAEWIDIEKGIRDE